MDSSASDIKVLEAFVVLFGIIGIIFLVILTIFLPVFIWRIHHHTKTTNKLLREIVQAYGGTPKN
jgi:hypothetical protein